ncbi:hypothetical protein [Hyphobacterium marinum]|uniref:DUF5640 domain-containing protein n=1 Tax=Hyphobacterium marinum TaxID=3116574 RepID=A0ABU7LVF1_9PROT|nr:hypothetical protein [Hyphobacterium sp. Y6023]MEE2565150.1 hypothetical protein [Hyphobacterium sp. Y6023]
MNRLTFIALGIGFILGLFAAFAVDQITQDDNAPWVGIRELRGCWSSGSDTLTFRQDGERSRELEARFGTDDQWREVETALDGDLIVAHFSNDPELYEFRFDARREGDRLTVTSALGDETSLRRCEPTA